MTITDICKELDQLGDDGVIYARLVEGEFVPESEAVVLAISDEELAVPTRDIAARRCPGFEYCLEVFIAKEAVQVWSHWRNGEQPNAAQLAEAVCYKANNDAWGPPNFPINGEAAGR
ncbi:MAG: hypothetical protein ACTHN5_01020 [Phycisphaerae bacterium]